MVRTCFFFRAIALICLRVVILTWSFHLGLWWHKHLSKLTSSVIQSTLELCFLCHGRPSMMSCLPVLVISKDISSRCVLICNVRGCVSCVTHPSLWGFSLSSNISSL